MTLCVPYLSMSGRLISSQNNTSHFPSCTGGQNDPARCLYRSSGQRSSEGALGGCTREVKTHDLQRDRGQGERWKADASLAPRSAARSCPLYLHVGQGPQGALKSGHGLARPVGGPTQNQRLVLGQPSMLVRAFGRTVSRVGTTTSGAAILCLHPQSVAPWPATATSLSTDGHLQMGYGRGSARVGVSPKPAVCRSAPLSPKSGPVNPPSLCHGRLKGQDPPTGKADQVQARPLREKWVDTALQHVPQSMMGMLGRGGQRHCGDPSDVLPPALLRIFSLLSPDKDQRMAWRPGTAVGKEADPDLSGVSTFKERHMQRRPVLQPRCPECAASALT